VHQTTTEREPLAWTTLENLLEQRKMSVLIEPAVA
jgi:hypothetical protein